MISIINETLLYLEDGINGVEVFNKIESLPLPKSLFDLTDMEHKLPLVLKFVRLLISWFPFIIGGTMRSMNIKSQSEWI